MDLLGKKSLHHHPNHYYIYNLHFQCKVKVHTLDNGQEKKLLYKKNMAIRNPKDQLDNTTMHHSLLPLKIELRLKNVLLTFSFSIHNSVPQNQIILLIYIYN